MARAPASMVIVSEYDGGEYCTGFVADTEASQGTIIITPHAFVEGREDRLRVCFFDGTELRASVYRTVGQFCLLMTEFHPPCKRVRLMQGGVTISPAMIFPPSSPTSFYRAPSFVSAESLESYPCAFTTTSRQTPVFIPTKGRFQAADCFFLVDCHYSEVTSDGIDRLFTAPVYDENECAMGIVIQKHESVKKLAMCMDALLHLLEIDGGDGKAEESAGNTRKRGGGEGSSKGHKGGNKADESAGNKRKRSGGEGHRGGNKAEESAGNKRKRSGGEGSSKGHNGGFGIGSKVSAGDRNKGGGKGGSKSKRGGHGISSKVKVSAASKGKMVDA